MSEKKLQLKVLPRSAGGLVGYCLRFSNANTVANERNRKRKTTTNLTKTTTSFLALALRHQQHLEDQLLQDRLLCKTFGLFSYLPPPSPSPISCHSFFSLFRGRPPELSFGFYTLRLLLLHVTALSLCLSVRSVFVSLSLSPQSLRSLSPRSLSLCFSVSVCLSVCLSSVSHHPDITVMVDWA